MYAHRGGPSRAPENTIAAFRLALADGAAGIECDLRATRDGEIVLFHDADLSRVTGAGGSVESLRWREIRRLRVEGREPVAHLHDLLELLVQEPAVVCYFDLYLRSEAAVESAFRLAASAGLGPRGYALAFTTGARKLAAARRACPGISLSVMPVVPVGLLRDARRWGAASVCAGWNQWGISRPWFRAFDRLLGFARENAALRAAGVEATGGVANDPAEVRWFAERGVEAVWTDDVPMARRALETDGAR